MAATYSVPTSNSAAAKHTTVGTVALDNTPVLAFGSGLTALGVLRSLQRTGVTVYSVCPPTDLVAKSRYYQPVPGYRGPFRPIHRSSTIS